MVLCVAPGAAPQTPDSPIFRAQSTLVSVNVSVTRGNRPVMGLTASSFRLTDNGVPQAVERLDREDVPIDATLIVDLSGSAAGFADEIRRDARRILGMLRPIDRGRVLAIHSGVEELRPMQATAGNAPLPAPTGTVNGSSVRDAILAAFMARTDPDRRRLIVAITDGHDNKSIVDARTLYELGRRSDAALHLVVTESPRFVRQADGGLAVPFSVFGNGIPFSRGTMTLGDWDFLLETAVATGGLVHGDPGSRSRGASRNAVAAFRDVFDEFRHSYVLRYQPQGVAAGGWHGISVTVDGVAGTEVRARRGYFAGSR